MTDVDLIRFLLGAVIALLTYQGNRIVNRLDKMERTGRSTRTRLSDIEGWAVRHFDFIPRKEETDP